MSAIASVIFVFTFALDCVSVMGTPPASSLGVDCRAADGSRLCLLRDWRFADTFKLLVRFPTGG